jgi:YggT family protein
MDYVSPTNPVFFLIHQITNVIFWIIIISVITSWLVAFNVVNVRHPLMRRIYEFINTVTEYLYRPIRKIMPTIFGGIDISPVVILVILQLINYTLFWLHMRYDL